jgi:hypothetical protein
MTRVVIVAAASPSPPRAVRWRLEQAEEFRQEVERYTTPSE